MNHLERIQPGRIYFIIIFYSALALIVIMRLGYLQLIEGPVYAEKAKKNIRAYLYEPAPRGLIYDRTGIPLVVNEQSWDLYFHHGNHKQLLNLIKELRKLSHDPLLDSAERRFRQQPSFEPLLLLHHLTEEQLEALSYMLYDRPCLTLKSRSVRKYPYEGMFAHVLGYTQPQKMLRFNQNQPITERAITGLEKSCDDVLRGEPKIISLEKTAHQKIVDYSELKEAKPGTHLYLTLDAQLQMIAYRILESYRVEGSLVALNPQNGEILVAVSYPSFDPEILREQPTYYDKEKSLPLFFRAFHGLYPPASLVKPMLALAALEEGVINVDTTIIDPGYYQLKGHEQRFHDWKKNGHGEVNVIQAVAQSCDTFFYALGDQLGIDVMHDWFSRFGFGMDFKLPVSHKKGILPSKIWKKQHLKERWYHGESVLTAIGQGYFSTTPLHLAYACALLASKGATPLPTLFKDQLSYDHDPYLSGLTHWDVIHEAMDRVVTSKKGTAHRRLASLKLPIVGKTGTAQVVSQQKSQRNYQRNFLDHSLFMAFAPKKNPSIAIAVVVEHQQYATEIAGIFFSKLVEQNILSKDE
jgi:penicillin-binding protein 2